MTVVAEHVSAGTGGTGDVDSYSASGLPSGLTISSSTGKITGTTASANSKSESP